VGRALGRGRREGELWNLRVQLECRSEMNVGFLGIVMRETEAAVATLRGRAIVALFCGCVVERKKERKQRKGP